MCQELNARKQENMQMEHGRGNRNNLLEYLRSLDSNMVIHLLMAIICVYFPTCNYARVVGAQAVELRRSRSSHSYLHVCY